MKKLVLIAVLALFIGAVGCDDSGISTGVKVTASLEALTGDDTFFHETKTVTINEEEVDVTYEFTTFGEKYDGDEGTGKIVVLVWASTELFKNDLDENTYAQTPPLATGIIKKDGSSSTIALDPGDYYVLIMYDYKSNGNGYAGKNEFYKFHDGVYDIDATNPITVTDGAVNDLGSVEIGNIYKFQKDAKWYEVVL